MRGGLHEAEPTTSNLRDVHWAVQKKQHTWASMHLLNSSPSGTEQPVNFRTRHHQSAHQLTKIKRKPNSTNWCEKKKRQNSQFYTTVKVKDEILPHQLAHPRPAHIVVSRQSEQHLSSPFSDKCHVTLAINSTIKNSSKIRKLSHNPHNKKYEPARILRDWHQQARTCRLGSWWTHASTPSHPSTIHCRCLLH